MWKHPDPDKIKFLSPVDILWEFKFGDITEILQRNLKVSKDPTKSDRQRGIAERNLIRMMDQNIKLYELELRKTEQKVDFDNIEFLEE